MYSCLCICIYNFPASLWISTFKHGSTWWWPRAARIGETLYRLRISAAVSVLFPYKLLYFSNLHHLPTWEATDPQKNAPKIESYVTRNTFLWFLVKWKSNVLVISWVRLPHTCTGFHFRAPVRWIYIVKVLAGVVPRCLRSSQKNSSRSIRSTSEVQTLWSLI